MTMSLLRQNDVATSFWRNNSVIIASCADWALLKQVSNERLYEHQLSNKLKLKHFINAFIVNLMLFFPYGLFLSAPML